MTTLTQDAPRGNRQHAKVDPEPVIVAEWPINKRGETARVSIEFYKGTWLINVRKWFEAEDGEMRPRKGLALSVRHLPQLTEAVAKALSIARERELIAAEHQSDAETAHP
jgi:Transcriptional Coactivator p15 (PC4)